MAVLHPADRHEYWEPADLECFFCGKQIDDKETAVNWSGQGSLILHCRCAEILAVHLLKDVREAELAELKLGQNRVALLVGAALSKSEGLLNEKRRAKASR